MSSTRFYLKTALERNFTITLHDIERIISNFHFEMTKGLNGGESSLKMLPAFIDKASGNEQGKFIALDLGGTNFRVLLVNLKGKGMTQVECVNKYVIPRAVMHGTGTQLFNFIAKSINNFIQKNKIKFEDKSKLGFTFSFPIKQTNIASGLLITWTKDFSATGVVGNNVVKMLRDALKSCGIGHINVVALANDTVGTLAAKSYQDPNCDVGIIFGTGTNACYVEEIANIRNLSKSARKAAHMVINMEWGNFNKLPLTPFDDMLDKASNNPGKQRMEKMISGMYLGELARLVLADLIKRQLIFTECQGKFSKGDFKTRHMSLIEADKTPMLGKINDYLESVGMFHSNLEDRKMLKKICKMVSVRAARISAAAISAVVAWMDPELKSNHTIGIDGTLYEKYPGFRRNILSTLQEIHSGKAKKIKLSLAKDGSGIGVAIVAAVAASR
ncbi:MAG: hexokinase [Pseudomonadota bacterium]